MTTNAEPALPPTPTNSTEAPPAAHQADDVLNSLSAMVSTLQAELAALKAASPAPVPPTDHGKPTITPVIPDFSTLPPIARMAAGYRK